jgi:hypothetical protein
MDASKKFFQTLQNVTIAAALTGCVYAVSSFAQTAIRPLAWGRMAIGAAPPNFEFQRTGQVPADGLSATDSPSCSTAARCSPPRTASRASIDR